MTQIISKTVPSKPRSGNYPTGSVVTAGGGGTVIINEGDGSNVEIVGESDRTRLSDSNVLSSLRAILETKKAALSIIVADDKTALTDENVLSSLKAIAEIKAAIDAYDLLADKKYLNADKPDTANELITFLKGLITDELKSTDYTAGAFGSGMRMWMQDGQSHAEIDNLHVRMEAIFNKLTIAELQSVGGQVVLSVADLQCVKVTEYDTYYRCYFDTKDGTIPNRWAINDQARCQNWNGNQKFYWRLVVSVGANYIDLSKIDCNGSGVPEARDAIVQLGNRTDLARQNAIVLSAYGVDAPSFNQYEGIHSYTTDGCEVTVISPKGNKITGDLRIKSGNKIIPIPADRGAFAAGESYRYYDRVSHDGALWLCVIAEGKTTTSAPPSEAWLKQVDKGADGKDGKDAGVNLLKWQDEWKEGALPAGWERCGSTEENSVIYAENPFKVRSLMWKCTPDINGESSGGYHTPPMLLDEKYAHRFSTFVFRVRTGNGGVYHGCYGLDDLSDTENGNPYFWSGDLPATEWFLMVGYIHPKGSVVSKSLSGVYNMKGEKIIEGADYKFRKPNVEIRPRNYLYYSNMPAGEVYFYNPMLHKLDGTEPSIEQMLQLSARKEIDAAKATSEAYAAAQAELARVKAEANADGKITAAEARAIADATNKADAARDAAIAAASVDAKSKIDAVKTTYDKKFESTDKQFLSVLSETKTYADKAVAGGGVNLLSNLPAEWISYNKLTIVDGVIRGESKDTYPRIWNQYVTQIVFDLTATYTLSFFARSSVNADRYVALSDMNGNNAIMDRCKIQMRQEWTKHNISFIPKLQAKDSTRLQFWTGELMQDYVNWIELKCVKLELGPVATPYTASPKDINAAIAASEENAKQYVKEQNYSTIKQTADSLQFAINNIKVGGNNLIPHSNVNFPLGTYAKRLVDETLTSPLVPGKTYIFTCDNLVANGYTELVVCDKNDNTWYRLAVNTPFTVDREYHQFWFYSNGSGQVAISRPKLAEGNTKTDWSPTQEERPTIDNLIASINLSKEEALINAERIRLKGKTVADAIQTDGLNVGDKTSIDKYGNFKTVNATISGSISMPFKRVTYQLGTSYVPDLSDIYNLVVCATPSANAADNWIVIRLPDASLYNGRVFNIFNNTTYIEGRTPINLTVIANPPNYPYNKIRVIGYGELVTFTSVGDGWFFHNQYREVIN